MADPIKWGRESKRYFPSTIFAMAQYLMDMFNWFIACNVHSIPESETSREYGSKHFISFHRGVIADYTESAGTLWCTRSGLALVRYNRGVIADAHVLPRTPG